MPSRGIPNEELFLTRPSNTPTPDSPTIEPLRIHKPTSPKPHHPQYPTPPISAPPAPFASAPAFSLSSGALSSANMISLPYPDEEDAAPVSLAAYQNGPRLGSPSEQKGPGLAQRRGTAPKPLSGPSSPSDELFIRPTQPTVAPSTSVHYPSLSKPVAPEPQGVNRFASTASTSTTRASRGSPPPPETPIVEPGETPASNIEARFAVPGISAQQNTQSAAASQRLAQYGSIPQPQSQAQQATRPWTPTEVPGAGPHGPPTVYQGSAPVQESHGAVPSSSSKPSIPQDTSNLQVSVLEQDFQRLGTKTPPPAYSSVTNGSARPQEKQRPENPATATVASPRQQSHQPQLSISTQLPAIQPVPQLQPQPQQATQLSKADMVAQAAAAAAASAGMASHPAFANDPGNPATGTGTIQMVSSPPPLPEGWMAHLDQNSGQYYYIHIATQATQWEFPKGPNPINHDVAPLSPTASTYGNPLASPLLTGKASMASPMFAPQTPGYAESIMSVAHSTAPSAAGFSGPPPSSGVELYKVAPTNGVYFGPYLRYINMDVTRGIWYGSILIVTDSPQPPSIHIHLSQDLSPNPRQLTPTRLAVHQRWIFWKYTIDLPMSEKGTERWTYAVTSHMGCTRYEFVVAGKHEVSWRFIAHSNNDFAPTTSQTERSKLGGLAFMWKDVLAKNVECGGYHVQLGLGNQIYGDRMWKEIPVLKSWLAMSGKENRSCLTV